MAETSFPIDRRDLVGAGFLAALVIGTPIAVIQAMKQGETGEASDRQRDMLRQVAQIVIPRTATPGGADVGAHDFVVVALLHGLDGTRAPMSGAAITGASARYRRPDGTLDYLAWLERELDVRAQGDFLRPVLARQQAAVEAIDTAAFAGGAADSPWRKVENLLLTGYYTSEAGATRELRYELVPGRWDPDVPLAKGDRAWSSDWTAVEFG